MFIGLLVLITALTISAVAIYYSVAGLVAIFAAAALPIMIMGGVLEVSKLVTAVWLHRYWKQATWWLKTYLSLAVVVLMFITSMGIFGFLSKAHIEQTSASEESVAQVQRIESEIGRLNGIIARAEEKIEQLQTSGTGADANIQAQIDKEQDRIDKAFERIQPAIDQQNKIIEDARAGDANRTKPYEDQLTNIQNEITRLETTAREYEDKIANLSADTSAVEPLLAQITKIEEEIIRVTNQLQSTEQAQVRAGQAIIGVTSDGFFGNNTREALAKWVAAQQDRISQIQGDISQLRQDATTTVDNERIRLAGIVKDIRDNQIPALKDRELVMLGKIDEVRQTESPVIQTARDEIQRLRKSAEDQVANSQALIERLRGQLAQTDKAAEIDAQVDEQNARIKTANDSIDNLTEEKYTLQAEVRKLEAEVGPIKYIAEFVYGEQADANLLEEAVRWVIVLIIFVFDPLAVLLLIASQYTFEFNRKRKDDGGGWLRQYEQARAQRIVDNPGYNPEPPAPPQEEKEEVDDASDITNTDVDNGDMVSEAGTTVADAVDTELEQPEVQTHEILDEGTVPEGTDGESSPGADDTGRDSPEGLAMAGENDSLTKPKKKKELKSSEELSPEQRKRKAAYEEKEKDIHFENAKTEWKHKNPNSTLKHYKNLYIKGVIDVLPWEREEGYKQNSEQTENSLFSKLRNNDPN